MNTINPVRSYMNLRNNQQTPNTQPQAPAFKGVIGKRVVEEITAKKPITVASILALVGGMIGLNKDKVADVMESFVDKIKGLQTENENLTQQLKQEKTKAAQEKEAAMREFAADKQQMQDGITHALVEKNLEIAEKDAKIAELQKYAAMANVKSVDELDIVSPEQFVELLNEAKENQAVAEQSLLNYLFNGNGQEEFLAQMERSNKILKAKQDGITNMEEIKKAAENVGIIIGYDSAYVAQKMLEKVLKNNEAGARVSYPPMKEQILKNADAIINPMIKTNNSYPSNKKVLDDVVKFYNDIEIQNMEFIKKYDAIFKSRNLDKNNKAYYTYTTNKGQTIDIYLDSLACGSHGVVRVTYPDGNIQDFWKQYQNL